MLKSIQTAAGLCRGVHRPFDDKNRGDDDHKPSVESRVAFSVNQFRVSVINGLVRSLL